MPEEKPTTKLQPFSEVGSFGLKHYGGFVQDEFLWQLQGQRGAKIYREMQDNSSIISASLYVLEKLLQQVEFKIEGEDEEQAEFVQSCMEDMSYSWSDTLSWIMTMVPFGYAPLELIYKRRNGWSKDGRQRSRFKDGRVGWRKIALRSQESVYRWEIEADGSIQGLYQQAAPLYKETYLPIEKLLLFRFNNRNNSPEGRSVLRGCYFDWYFFKKFSELLAVGIERDTAGTPIGRVPADAPDKVKAEMRKILERLRNHEQAMLMLSSDKDEHGQFLQTIELLSSPGAKQFDIQRVIERLELRMALTMLTDGLLVGHEGSGSYALADNKTEQLELSLSGIADIICDVFTRHAIPRLLLLNGESIDEAPRMVHSDVSIPDLKGIAALLESLSKAGVDVFPDDELVKQIYMLAKLTTKGREKIEAERDDLRPENPEAPPEIPDTPEVPAKDEPAEEPDEAEEPEDENTKKPEVAKGDLPGHEFRGNQWTGGGGYDSLSSKGPALKGRELSAVKTYTTSAYLDMNGSLRGVDRGKDETTQRAIRDLDSAFSRVSPLDEPVIVYRGLGRSAEKLIGKPGTVFQDLGFSSTSVDPSVASIFSSSRVLRISVPAGAKILPVDRYTGSKNREMLLGRGTRFRVKGVSKSFVDLEVIHG